VRAWRGSFTENVVSATCRDLLVAAMHRLEPNYRAVLHVHDELICEVPEEFGSEQEFIRLMIELPPWATRFPVAARAWTRKRYAKTKTPKPTTVTVASKIIKPALLDAPQFIAQTASTAADDETDVDVDVSMQDLISDPVEDGRTCCPFHDDHG